MTNVLYTKNSKSLLAKMMAEEDITIQHKNIDTAYFDIKNRILAVPIWKDMSDDLYDLFMGHEVGHALYTPSDTDVLQEACSRSTKDFINVVEDARIERDVKNKFPGLRGPFFRAYQELMNKDFFGIQGKELSGLAFIDRINIFFKSSMTDFEMKKIFSDEEIVLVNKVASTKTFAEVADVSEEIFNFLKMKKEQKEQNPEENETDGSGNSKSDGSGEKEETDQTGDNTSQNQSDESSDETDDTSSDSSDTGSDELDESGNSDASGNGEEEAQEKDNGSGGPTDSKGAGSSDGTESQASVDEFSSETDSSMSQNMSSMVDQNASDINYLSIPDIDLKDYVIDIDRITRSIETIKSSGFSDKHNMYKQLLSDHNNTIGYLVKEFEMKKSAQEYAQSYETKSGNLNTSKIWSYKLNDDIFKRKSVSPEGKNHGMVMMVDWSGSMHGMIYKTVVQTIVLATFCQRVGIPFDVYNFSDQNTSLDSRFGEKRLYAERDNPSLAGKTFIMSGVRLHHMLTSNMKKSEFQKACNNYLFIAWMMENAWGYCRTSATNDVDLTLGGTPLNHSLIILDKVIDVFKKKHNVEKMNFIVLTDGSAGDSLDYWSEGGSSNYNRSVGSGWSSRREGLSVIKHERTKKTFVLKTGRRDQDKTTQNATEFLVTMMKEIHDAKSVGFFIADRNYELNHAIRDYVFRNKDGWIVSSDISKQRSIARKQGYLSAPDCGYDDYYVVDMRTQNEQDELAVDTDMSKAKIAKQFSKFQSKKKTSRQLLNKFVDIVK